MRWLFLGAGQIVQSLMPKLLNDSDRFTFYSPTGTNALKSASLYCGEVVPQLDPLPIADIYVLACKPQQFLELAQSLAGRIPRDAIVISLMAGISLKMITENLLHQNILRVMPNTPCKIGEGVLILLSHEIIDSPFWQKRLAPLGLVVSVATEDQFDQLTCVAGSGPGYIFEWARQWQENLDSLQLEDDVKRRIVAQIFSGSSQLMKECDHSFEQLKQQVTSKAGVTAEGIKMMPGDGFLKIYQAARKRLEELKQLFGNKP